MGKRIISQARGKGSHTYRVKRSAFRFRIKFPSKLSGVGKILKLMDSGGHTSPLAKVSYEKGSFYIPAFKGVIEGGEITFVRKEIKDGNILILGDLPVKTGVYNIESKPGDGGVFIRSAGSSGVVNKTIGDYVFVLMPSKKEKKFNKKCRVVIGIIAGSGRLDKPILKAGKQFHIKKTKSKLWPRTSAVKMNAVDHPFGSGRAKNPKSKIAKRNAPPGRKVGLLRPRRTGKRK